MTLYAFVKIQGGVGRAFEQLCEEMAVDPGDYLSAMVQGLIASKNIPLPPPQDMGEGNDMLCAIYLKMRETYQALNKACDKEVNDIKAQMTKIEGTLLEVLNKNKCKNMAVEGGGVFYKQKDIKPSADNWEVIYGFITEEQRFDMLERRLTKKTIEEYMEENGEPPPGVTVLEEWKVIVRKGKDT